MRPTPRSQASALSVTALASCMLAICATLAAEANQPIAGIDPSKRPEGAPAVHQVDRGRGWYRRALYGVTRPYPKSLKFLEDQGNWYTPFDLPGMTGPYDIRRWHGR